MTAASEKQLNDALAAIGAASVLPLMIIWHGFCASSLWLWFVVPIFNAPPLSIAGASGLALVLRAMPVRYGVKDDGYTLGARILQATSQPAFLLLIGWIIKVAGWPL